MGSLRQLSYLLFPAVIIIKTEIWCIFEYNYLKYQNKIKQHLYLPDFQKTELKSILVHQADIIKSSKSSA